MGFWLAAILKRRAQYSLLCVALILVGLTRFEKESQFADVFCVVSIYPYNGDLTALGENFGTV